ncbi:integrator complex subunit 3-like [Tigriopus californicus]|nr:integrator complex subunit 3-like [Tigriopus californicus]
MDHSLGGSVVVSSGALVMGVTGMTGSGLGSGHGGGAGVKKGGSPSAPRLFMTSVIESRDDLEERHDRCFALVQALVTDKTEKESNDALAGAVSKDPKTHEDICLGLMIGVLSDAESAPRYFRDLTLVARDGLIAVYTHLTHLVLEKYPKLFPAAKQQLLWLTREMIKSSVTGMENIVWNLMRQIAGGDVSRPNLWLADQLLDIFVEHRAWLEKFPFLLASVVYTYLRVIEDHFHVDKLREKEVKFVISLIRERFTDVMVIGRDLVRVLQYVAKIPEFQDLWQDMIHHPRTLSPSFTGITQLMHTRTSRRFLQSRITPEMEKKLVFFTSQVRFGTHKRYQDWFQRQYLSTPESQSLRCDLIRFIVGVIHPTNELLGSDIIPRWAIIGWLLTTCTIQVASSNAKLALFYDWLFFVPDKDNIMNIEPAILVMQHSMRHHPNITATLLDFLCRIIVNFHPKEQEKVRSGIYNSLNTIVEKRVVSSLSPLFDNSRLDKELRALIRERFAPFFPKESAEPLPQVDRDEDADGSARFSDEDDEENAHSKGGSTSHNATPNSNAVKSSGQGHSSSPSSPNKKNHTGRRQSSGDESESGNGSDELPVEELDDDIKETLKELKAETECEKRCELIDNLVKTVISEQLDFEQCSALASQLTDVIPEEFEGRIFPENPTLENIEDSIGRPLFVLFRSLCEMSDSDQRTILLQILAELYTLQLRIGYYLLYFLSADKAHPRSAKEKASIYKDLCEAIDEKFSLDICLVNDMRQCQEDDVNLFVYLVPEIFTNFPKHSVGNVNLLYLVVACVDGRQVQTLVCHIIAKDFVMFKKDSFPAILQTSLTWETFEQYALWQLTAAHDLPIDCVLPLVPKLSFSQHSEALTSVLLLLKQERPTNDLLKHLLTREAETGDRFVSAALIYWMHEYDDKLGDIISNHLSKQSSAGPGKRKRNQPSALKNGALSHSAELCLHHLDDLRQICKQYEFFNLQSIQSALHQAKQACTDTQKKKFMDLFAMVDSDSEPDEPSSNNKRRKDSKSTSNSVSKSPGKGKQPKNNVSATKVSESSDESSEGSEENEKPSSRGSAGKQQRGGGGGGRVTSGNTNNKRKRAKKVSSYKISTDETSEDEEVLAKKVPKKKKKVSPPSDSD